MQTKPLTRQHVDDGQEHTAHLVLGIQPHHEHRAKQVIEQAQTQAPAHQQAQGVVDELVCVSQGALHFAGH